MSNCIEIDQKKLIKLIIEWEDSKCGGFHDVFDDHKVRKELIPDFVEYVFEELNK